MNALEQLHQARQHDPLTLEAWEAFITQHPGPAADYMAQQELILKTPLDAPEAAQARERLLTLRAALSDQERALLDQPALSRANATPFAQYWWSVGLGEYRPEHGTYTCYPYASLPPVPSALNLSDFSYMDRDEPEADAAQDVLDWLAYIKQSAEQKGLTLPSDFVAFFGEPKNLNGINSCTDCFFDLEEDFCKEPTGSGAYMLRFYADSQGCLFWYLLIHPSGYSAIVVGDYVDELGQDEPISAAQAPLHFCSPSFGEFIWRFWLENELWDKVAYPDEDEEPSLDETERQYLDALAHFAQVMSDYEESLEEDTTRD